MPEFTAITPQPFPFARAMRARDAAQFLNLSETRINHLVDAGTLRAHKLGGGLWINFEDVALILAKRVGSPEPARG